MTSIPRNFGSDGATSRSIHRPISSQRAQRRKKKKSRPSDLIVGQLPEEGKMHPNNNVLSRLAIQSGENDAERNSFRFFLTFMFAPMHC